MTEAGFDEQIMTLFDKLRVESDEFRDQFRKGLRESVNWDQDLKIERSRKLQEELESGRQQQKRLLNLRMLEEIEADTFAIENTALRDRTVELQMEIEACDRGRNEMIDIAVKVFELSQSLRDKWFEADYAAKRRILEIICLNWTLDDVTLVPEMRKPFDMIAEGLVWKDSRGGRI